MLFSDFLDGWPDATSASSARGDTQQRFLQEHHVRNRATIDAGIAAIKQALPLTEDEGVVLPARLTVEALVQQLRPLLVSIVRYDEEIEKLADAHADYALFRSLPGAGDTLAPRLLAAFGEDRERYDSAAEVQRYASRGESRTRLQRLLHAPVG